LTDGFTKGAEEERFRGRTISVGVAEFVAPDGEHFERDIVHHPGAVSIVAVGDGPSGPEATLVRQWRSAIERPILEVPAGTRDVEGEALETTAARELAEEVGLRAGHMERLASFYNSPGFCDEWSHVFLATDLVEVGTDLQGAEELHMTIERVPLAAVPAMITAGEIVDAKTIIGLLLARQRLGLD